MSNNTIASEVTTLSQWYALYTKHQHEKTVVKILANKGFETLLPLYQTAHRWKDRTKAVSLPLFPCYVFLKGGLDRKLAVMTTPGVFALVSSGGEPAAILDTEMAAIRRTIDSGASMQPHPFLKCGEWVRVKSGPLAGVEGILERKKSISKLVLSIEMLGKSAAVEIDSFLVEPILRKSVAGHGTGREVMTRNIYREESGSSH